jgi:hypothetical protein
MNYNPSTQARLADINLGMRVNRDTAVIANGQNALFTVTGGRVAVIGLIGEVTSAMDATATTLQIVTNPTVGSDTVLCIASASIANAVAGQKYTLPAAVGSALVTSTNQGAASLALHAPWIVSAGTIDLVASAANAGLAKWSIFYVPVDDGAYITAA